MVALFELSQDFLRVLPVKLILFVVPEDPALVEQPVRNAGRMEGRDISGIRDPKHTLTARRPPNRDFR